MIRKLRLLWIVALAATLTLAQTVQPTVLAKRILAIPNCTGGYSMSATPVNVSGTAQLQEDTSNGNLTGSLNITGPIPSTGSVQATVMSNGSVNGTLTIAALPNPVPFTGNVNADCSTATLQASVLGISDTITLVRTSSPTPTNTPVPPTSTNTPVSTKTPTHTPAPTNTPGGGTNTPTNSPTNTPPAGTATATPTDAFITLGSTQVSPFQHVAVNGGGFGANENVRLFWNNQHGFPLLTARTNSSGAFSVKFYVPPAVTGGYNLYARGMKSKDTAHANVQVEPVVYLLHTSGQAGSLNVAWGFGFGSNEKVVAMWQSGSVTLGQATTGRLGTFGLFSGIVFHVPQQSPGQYQVTVTGQTSNVSASRTFTLNGGGPAPTNTPTSMSNPTNTPTTQAAATNTPTSASGSTNTPTPTATATSSGSSGPPTATPQPPNGVCTGVYSIAGSPLAIMGTATLQEVNGTISGSLNIASPIPSSGSVQGTVAPDGTVNGTMTITALGGTPITVTGNTNSDCSMGTLNAFVLNTNETVTLNRTGALPTPTPTSQTGGGNPPTATLTPVPTATSTPLPPITPSPSRDCSGNYNIGGDLPGFGTVVGTAQLQDTGGSISGSLNFSGPIPTTGSVVGTVASDGTVHATITLGLSPNGIAVTGSVNADCSSGSLSGTALGITATFTLTRVSGGPGGGSTSGGGTTTGGSGSPSGPTLTHGVTYPPTVFGANGCPPQGTDLVLSTKVMQSKVPSGGMVNLGIQSTAGITYNVVLEIVTTQSHFVGTGKQRHEVSGLSTLFTANATGTTDKKGHGTSKIHITYNPSSDATAQILVVAQNGCAVGVSKTQATILHKFARFAIGAQVAAASSPRGATGTSCTASVSLKVKVTFSDSKTWSKGAVLVYQPPAGVRVLNAGKGYHGTGAARFAIPKPSNDQSTVLVKLSAHPGTVRIKTAHGWRIGFQVQIGGTLNVMSKHSKLGQVTLNVGQPQLCGGKPSKAGTGKPAPTPTPVPQAAQPTATPSSGATSSGPSCSGAYSIAGSVGPGQVAGTVMFNDNHGHITGTVNITQGPIPSAGTVTGSVSPTGAVQGTMLLDKLQGVVFNLTGTVNSSCTAGTLSGVVLGVQSTFYITRTGM